MTFNLKNPQNLLIMALALAVICFFALPSVLYHTQDTAEDGLVRQYNFDTDLTDSIGSNDGTIQTASIGTGNFLGGLSIDAGEYSTFPTATYTTATYSVWVKGDAYTGTTLIPLGQGSTNYIARFDNGLYRLVASGTSIDLVTDVPNLGTWEHWVITSDGTTATYYINGVKKGTNPNVGGKSLTITKSGTIMGGFEFDGTIDEFRIYDVVLADNQVESLYQAGASYFSLDYCTDGIQNGNEEGVDCGGICPASCSSGEESAPTVSNDPIVTGSYDNIRLTVPEGQAYVPFDASTITGFFQKFIARLKAGVENLGFI
jgi:hypothetical protein